MSLLQRKTLSDSKYSTYSTSVQSNKITKEDCEKKIMNRFSELTDKQTFHNYFSSYDFRDNEKSMLDFWEQIIYYFYDEIFNSFGMKVSDILNYSKFKNSNPIGLENILIHLNNLRHFITEKDLNDIEFYKSEFPDIYNNDNKSWSEYISGYAKSIFNLGLGCKTEKNNIDLEKIPKLDNNQIFINYQMFQNHCDDILNFLTEILREKDHEVILKSEFNQNLLENNNIRFGNQYLDLCLKYLVGIKRIALFKVEIKGLSYDCIKLLKFPNDTVTNKDFTIINILISIENLNKVIEDTEKKILFNRNKAKEYLKMKNKDGAREYLKKAKIYVKVNQNYTNMVSTLEQKILDLKEMETNISTKNILNEAIKVSKDLGINLDDFDKMADDLKEQKNNQIEVNNIIQNAANENIDEEEIEGELEQLKNNDFDDGDLDNFLPEPGKNNINLNDKDKENNNKNKE